MYRGDVKSRKVVYCLSAKEVVSTQYSKYNTFNDEKKNVEYSLGLKRVFFLLLCIIKSADNLNSYFRDF